MRRFALALLLASTSPTVAALDEPLMADRPTIAVSTVTTPRGTFTLESGATLEREGDARTLTAGEFLLRWAVYESIEIRLDGALYRDDREGSDDGVPDPSLGAKVELVDYSYGFRPEIALLAESTVPAGSDAVGEPGWQPRAALLVGWDLPRAWHLRANLGARRASSAGERFTQVTLAAAALRPIGGEWSLFAEGAYVDERAEGRGSALFAGIGLTRAIGARAAFDARVTHGFDDADPSYALGAGFSFQASTRRKSGTARGTASSAVAGAALARRDR